MRVRRKLIIEDKTHAVTTVADGTSSARRTMLMIYGRDSRTTSRVLTSRPTNIQ